MAGTDDLAKVERVVRMCIECLYDVYASDELDASEAMSVGCCIANLTIEARRLNGLSGRNARRRRKQ